VGDDYLWNREGAPDPDVEHLEILLATFRHAPSASFDPSHRAVDDAAAAAASSPVSFRHPALLALAAALIAAIGVGWIVARSAPPAAWGVSSLEGRPTVGSRQIGKDGRLPVGEWLQTGAEARARIDVNGVGRVDVEPQSRLRLSSARDGNYRLRLTRGTMHAIIWAPPGQFFVDTPSSTAIDLGCAYTLRVGDDGAGIVEVTSGWVGFEWKGKESFIPAGAMCATRPGIGPGTPHYTTVSPTLAAALTTFDFDAASPSDRTQAVTAILAEAQPNDAVTLWHLLQRVDLVDRDRVFDRLAMFVPPPEGVTREGVHAGQREMLDRWWDQLGLGSMHLWREWQQGWHETR
jgi:FecR protein